VENCRECGDENTFTLPRSARPVGYKHPSVRAEQSHTRLAGRRRSALYSLLCFQFFDGCIDIAVTPPTQTFRHPE